MRLALRSSRISQTSRII
uniref:Uncharacterized protein n=1 Tax=Arundo donax TaxID=35708 RepID=A0A0A9C4E3_ARUDO